MGRMPMFPLGTVLFPSLFLPLHVFEERYRVMTRECLAGDREFGVVLIERGSEVGGDDVRTDVGTIARIVEAEELPDGRWVLATIGTRRIRVERWLDDDPYPCAEVVAFDDGPHGPDVADRLAAATALLRRGLALKTELGETTTRATIEFAEDPALASLQLAAVAPVGPLDQQRLLSLDSTDRRLDALRELLSEECRFLEQRLAAQ